MWEKVKRSTKPNDQRCMKHKWVFEIKKSGKFRSRLVACRHSQTGGVDFTQVHSPVVNDVTFCIWLLFSMMRNLTPLVFNVNVAFLNGKLEEEMHMDCPKGLCHEKDECLLLKKTIYGLIQSAQQHGLKFQNMLVELGFKQCPSDPCLFYRKNHLGPLMLVSHVDDNACAGDEAAIDDMLKGLNEHGLTYARESP